MKYLRIYVRGRWSKIHYTSDAGIRSLCGIVIAGVTGETELSNEQRPDGTVCARCRKRLENDGEVAYR
jgi:hypothetical protein